MRTARTDRQNLPSLNTVGEVIAGEIVAVGPDNAPGDGSAAALIPRRTRDRANNKYALWLIHTRNPDLSLAVIPHLNIGAGFGVEPFTRVLLCLLHGLQAYLGIVECAVSLSICHLLVGDVLWACRLFPRGCAGRPTGTGGGACSIGFMLFLPSVR